LNSREQARRSLVANREIRRGEFIKDDDIAIKRPGVGIKPIDVNLIVGSQALCDIQYDEILRWDMFLRRKQ
jgi:sialic acid synthase SpsE